MTRTTVGSFVLTLSALLLCSSTTWAEGLPPERAQNWHRFRGPEGTGSALHGNPPATWDKQTNVKWDIEIPGRGSASPIIWGNKVFLLTAIKTDRTELAENPARDLHRSPIRFASDTGQKPRFLLVQQPSSPTAQEEGERPRRRGRRGFFGSRGGPPTNVHEFVVLCLDRETGKTIWQETACEAIPHEGHHGTASFASASPVTDGQNLYISFGSRGIFSYTMDGKLRWKQDLGDMRTRNSFGEGASPALYGDTLVINWDQEEQSFIAALDTATGDVKWKVDRDEATSWSSPVVVQHSGNTQVIVNGSNRVKSYDLDSGEVIWECGGLTSNPVATPLVYQDFGIFMTGRRGYAAQAIKLDSTGDVTDTDQIAWTLEDGTPYVPSPVLVGDRLYFTKGINAILTCVNAETGEVFYKNQRLEGLDQIYSSLVGVEGKVYISGRNGTTLVIKDGPEYEILATNELEEAIDATPAIVDNEIFIRTENHLYCIANQ